MFLLTFMIGRSPIPAATYNVIPTGGVTRPIQKVTTITTPKWMGLTPIAIADGVKIGAKINTAGTGSKKHPTINRMTPTTIIKTVGLSEICVITSAISWGKPCRVRTQLNN